MTTSDFAIAAETLATLPGLLRYTRRQRGLNLIDAGNQLGIASSSVWEIENGRPARTGTAIRILRWIDQEAERRSD